MRQIVAVCCITASLAFLGLATGVSGSGSTEALCRLLSKPAPGTELGTLSIPREGIATRWVQGPWTPKNCTQMYHEPPDLFLPELDRAAAHYPPNALPWQAGAVVISGHRTTHTHPFFNLGSVHLGDLVVLRTARGSFRYRVVTPPPSSSFIKSGWDIQGAPCAERQACGVSRSDVGWMLTQWHFRSGHWLELLTCNPPGDATDRIVVFARLVNS